ncbi:MAG: hypothetical protein MZV70_50575 [Desulfobacterales bacterium]|nr:hypothetical protein [Desulfobacterales bacterium]
MVGPVQARSNTSTTTRPSTDSRSAGRTSAHAKGFHRNFFFQRQESRTRRHPFPADRSGLRLRNRPDQVRDDEPLGKAGLPRSKCLWWTVYLPAGQPAIFLRARNLQERANKLNRATTPYVGDVESPTGTHTVWISPNSTCGKHTSTVAEDADRPGPRESSQTSTAKKNLRRRLKCPRPHHLDAHVLNVAQE